jgi:YggT family protein
MFVPGYFLLALAEVLNIVLEIYKWVVIISALISWVNPDPYNPIVRFLYSVTDPVYRAIRRRLPLPNMPIDISPLIVILAIVFLQYFLVGVLVRTAQTLV